MTTNGSHTHLTPRGSTQIPIHGSPDSGILELHLRCDAADRLQGYVLASWSTDEYVVWHCWMDPLAGVLRVEGGDYFGPYTPSTCDGKAMTPLEQARKCLLERAGLAARS